MSALACLVRTHGEPVLQRWADHAGAVDGAPEPGDPGDRDDPGQRMPGVLGELEAALRAGRVPPRIESAAHHGRQGYRLGLAPAQLVHELGVLQDAVLATASDAAVAIAVADVRVLGGFTVAAIAESVAAHARASAARSPAAFHASEAQLQLVTDALPFLISYFTADDRYGLINLAYEQWFGQKREALLGRTLREVIGDTAYTQMTPIIRRGLAGETFSIERHRVHYRGAGIRDVRVTYVPHRDPAGVVLGVVALVEDITRRLELERDHGRLAHQRTEVLESMGDAFCALDAEWRFILVNRKYEALAQLDRSQVLGRVFWDLFPAASEPGSPYAEAFHRCMRDRVTTELVVPHGGPDPSLETSLEIRVSPASDGGISAFFRDVSIEKRAEAEAQRRLEFEQQLIGIVSHDLRNPLNVVLLGSNLLLGIDDLSAPATKHLVRIRNSADRAARLVRDLLDFTKARLGGGIPIEPRSADLHAIVRTAVEEVQAAFPGREVTLQREGDGRGAWDPDRIAQVIHNLVSNALKYSPGDTAVEVLSYTLGDRVGVRVDNAGAPIPADKLPVIFEPLQRAAGHVDHATRSVGLGLYIVKQIAEAHQGDVAVRSDASCTTFTVTLPRRSIAST